MKLNISSALKRLLLGKDLALASTILGLIAGMFGTLPPSELAKLVYQRLPKNLKAPLGPASEKEFIDMIHSGIQFYRALRRVMTRV